MKKKVAIILSLLLLTLIGVITYNQAKLSDEVIRQQFYCNRATDDHRKTDVYCNNPELYRQHEREANIIGDRAVHIISGFIVSPAQ